MNSKTKKLVTTALMTALVCVATLIIKIPSPLKGYLNLGDCIVLLAGWILSPAFGFFAAGFGSALADLISGYVLYAPVTFVIKGLMALVAYIISKQLGKKIGKFSSRLVGGILAEILMVLGYYIFEGACYGFIPSAVNIPANCIQGVAGLVIGLVLIQIFEKAKLSVKGR